MMSTNTNYYCKNVEIILAYKIQIWNEISNFQKIWEIFIWPLIGFANPCFKRSEISVGISISVKFSMENFG